MRFPRSCRSLRPGWPAPARVLGQWLLPALLVVLPAFAAAAPIRIACLGDSITYGTRVKPATESYPARLQVLLGDGFEVRSFALGGSTMVEIGERHAFAQLPAATAFNPDIAIVMFGINDTRQDRLDNWKHFPAFAPTANRLVDALLALPARPRVILCLPTASAPELPGLDAARIEVLKGRMPRMAAIHDVLRDVAASRRDRGVVLVDLHAVTAGRPELFDADALHLNVRGYQLLADTLAPQVRSLASRP